MPLARAAVPPIAAPPPERRPNVAALARVFDSAHPVRARSELFGRDAELSELLTAALHARQHLLVHGARGSGKTSLARIFGDYADQQGVIVSYLACEHDTTFADLMLPYLQSLPAAAFAPGHAARFQQRVAALPADFGPRMFVDLVSDEVVSPVVLILDEVDRIEDPSVKTDISVLMKLLSDSLSEILLMLVGIAENIEDVVSSHPSLRRHLRTVALRRISTESVDALVERGGASIGLEFSSSAKGLISRVACGSPYHVRLFCLHGGLVAARAGQTKVAPGHVLSGFRSAFRAWASMSRDDAGVFIRVVKDTGNRPSAERLAREAATSGFMRMPMGSDDAQVADQLGAALVQDARSPESLSFRDSIAPQFLLALLMVADHSGDGVAGDDLLLESDHALLD